MNTPADGTIQEVEAAEAYVYAMPSLGADMDEGTIIEWLVAPGDRVERGNVVARVETEKSDIDIEIWVTGVVRSIDVAQDETVAVGTPLLVVDPDDLADASGVPTGPATERAEPTEPAERSEPAEPVPTLHGRREDAPTMSAPPMTDGRVAASPLARRRASELGVDLTTVSGSGPDGAVRARDLTATEAPARPTASQPSGRSRADRMRHAIAERMSRSNDEIPHYRLERLVDLSGLLERLDQHNREVAVGDRVVPTAAFVNAVASTLAKHPRLNGTWSDGAIVPADAVDVAVAISTRAGGLLAPTITRADELDIVSTMDVLRELTTAVRSGAVRDQWFGGSPATTVTSLADRGPDVVHGMITIPQLSLVGFGRIAERPVVVEGVVVARPTVIVSLDADHRATDGADGGRFIDALATTLESATF